MVYRQEETRKLLEQLRTQKADASNAELKDENERLRDDLELQVERVSELEAIVEDHRASVSESEADRQQLRKANEKLRLDLEAITEKGQVAWHILKLCYVRLIGSLHAVARGQLAEVTFGVSITLIHHIHTSHQAVVELNAKLMSQIKALKAKVPLLLPSIHPPLSFDARFYVCACRRDVEWAAWWQGSSKSKSNAPTDEQHAEKDAIVPEPRRKHIHEPSESDKVALANKKQSIPCISAMHAHTRREPHLHLHLLTKLRVRSDQ